MTQRRSFLALAGAAIVGGFASLAAQVSAKPRPTPITGTNFLWDCPVCGSTMQLSAQVDLVTPVPPPTPSPTAAPTPTA